MISLTYVLVLRCQAEEAALLGACQPRLGRVQFPVGYLLAVSIRTFYLRDTMDARAFGLGILDDEDFRYASFEPLHSCALT